MNFYTADPHFGHEGIINICNRPFRTLAQMERTIIRNINNVVSDKDDLYIAGDFCWYGPTQKSMIERLVNRINGRKHLILGNHDKLKGLDYVDCGFMSVHTSLKVNKRCIFHDPSISIMFPGNSCVVGHIHNLFKVLKNCINVGVDVWDFKPVDDEDLRIIEIGGMKMDLGNGKTK